MHALDVLGDPVRRRILELLADPGGPGTSAPEAQAASDPGGQGTSGPEVPELGAGEIGEIVQREFGISQPAVSQHLRVLREHGFATVRSEGRRRLYAVDARGPQEAREWLTPFERFWLPKLDALGTELARGKLQRRRAADAASSAASGTRPSAVARTTRTPSPSAPGALPSAAPTPKET